MKFLYLILAVFMVFVPAYTYASDSEIEPVCQALEGYPAGGADYAPGVDLDGKPVAPADLDAGIDQPVFNPVIIPIEIDLKERYGLDLPVGGEARPYVAEVEINQDGRVFYNGQDITDPVRQDCAQAHESVVSPQNEDLHDQAK